jgi:hypothetical protein
MRGVQAIGDPTDMGNEIPIHGSILGKHLHKSMPTENRLLDWSSGQGESCKNHYYILNDLDTKRCGLPNGWEETTTWHGMEGKETGHGNGNDLFLWRNSRIQVLLFYVPFC